MNAILKYPGGKWRIAPWIISHFPPHKVYCEPFFGKGGKRACNVRKTLSDARSERKIERWDGCTREFERIENSGADFRRRAPKYAGGEWWQAEPDVGRVAHGVPALVDKLRGLGNAVVPYQAFPLFEAIAEFELSAKYYI